jgi:hypothetical protein
MLYNSVSFSGKVRTVVPLVTRCKKIRTNDTFTQPNKQAALKVA